LLACDSYDFIVITLLTHRFVINLNGLLLFYDEISDRLEINNLGCTFWCMSILFVVRTVLILRIRPYIMLGGVKFGPFVKVGGFARPSNIWHDTRTINGWTE
jgi:hypothetical protein